MSRWQRLTDDVRALASFGPRNLRDADRAAALEHAAAYVEERLRGLDIACDRDSYDVGGRAVANVIAELPATHGDWERPAGAVVIGAHYDTHGRSPGANDNATGVAVLLWLAEALRDVPRARPLRLAAFANEEHPFTRTRRMGSARYAAGCRDRGEDLSAMVSLETLGSPSRGRRARLPFRLLSVLGVDVVALVANPRSHGLSCSLRRGLRGLRSVRPVCVTAPGFLPLIKSSDHWSFWKAGYAAVMVTDGALLRDRAYHQPEDRFEHVDLERLDEVAGALAGAVRALVDCARDPGQPREAA